MDALAHADAVGIDWFIWRVVRAGRGSLTELKTSWSLHDLFDAHAVLDLETAHQEATHDLMRARAEEAERRRKRS